MIHLRLLSFNDCDLEELPSFVGDLKNLQILRANNWGCSFPDIFYKMKKLRYLQISFFHRYMQSSTKRYQFNGLNRLETLHGFNSRHDGQYTDLSKLVNIQDFSGSLYGYEMVSTFLEQIIFWQKLRFMYIIVDIDNELDLQSATMCCQRSHIEKNFTIVKELFMFMSSVECHLELQCQIDNLPKYEPQLCRNLSGLLLYDTFIEEDPMQFLKELPNLRDLSFFGHSFVGKKMVCDSKSFPKLKFIGINDLPNIEKWKLEAGAMPNLSEIQIRNCKLFEIVPDGLNNLSSLRKIYISDMPFEFKLRYGKLPSQEHRIFQ